MNINEIIERIENCLNDEEDGAGYLRDFMESEGFYDLKQFVDHHNRRQQELLESNNKLLMQLRDLKAVVKHVTTKLEEHKNIDEVQQCYTVLKSCI